MANEVRWGVGLLETNRQSEAKPGEAMSSRDVGLFATMNQAGTNMISYEYMSRFKSTYADFKSRLIASGNIGKIAKIDLGNDPAIVLTNNTAITSSDLMITNKKVSFIRFNADIDVIDKVSGVPISCNPSVTLSLTVATNAKTSTTKTYGENTALKDLNNVSIVPDYTGFETVSSFIDHKLMVNSFKVALPAGVDASTVTIILNSLLVAYKEAE